MNYFYYKKRSNNMLKKTRDNGTYNLSRLNNNVVNKLI